MVDIRAVVARVTELAQSSGWQAIETAPKDEVVDFWVVPKTADETYCDTSGKPILSGFTGRHTGLFKSWSSLSKATHWRPLPAPPSVETQECEK